MVYDNSVGYTKKSWRNFIPIGGSAFVDRILSILRNNVNFEGKSYVDVGCSTGYITAAIVDEFNPRIGVGMDVSQPSLEVARQRYPNIEFEVIDLNHEINPEIQFDIITCTETLEHVGDLNTAIDNILRLRKSNGYILVVVPDEIGFIGILRVLWRVGRYGPNAPHCFSEFSEHKNIIIKYLWSLLVRERVSKYRDKRSNWCTHFGFDYRDIDDHLTAKGVKYMAHNKYGNRFYIM
jgi:2-polyprenyl-3-methyl-5-hydroxy-6-metoxy-1,4-benzoquinol methylase